jgi:hypothetical protein
VPRRRGQAAFASIIDPDGAALFFEIPTSMVPEDLAYLP